MIHIHRETGKIWYFLLLLLVVLVVLVLTLLVRSCRLSRHAAYIFVRILSSIFCLSFPVILLVWRWFGRFEQSDQSRSTRRRHIQLPAAFNSINFIRLADLLTRPISKIESPDFRSQFHRFNHRFHWLQNGAAWLQLSAQFRRPNLGWRGCTAPRAR